MSTSCAVHLVGSTQLVSYWYSDFDSMQQMLADFLQLPKPRLRTSHDKTVRVQKNQSLACPSDSAKGETTWDAGQDYPQKGLRSPLRTSRNLPARLGRAQ